MNECVAPRLHSRPFSGSCASTLGNMLVLVTCDVSSFGPSPSAQPCVLFTSSLAALPPNVVEVRRARVFVVGPVREVFPTPLVQ